MPMPDYVFEGQTKRYFFTSDQVNGSTCTWWVNGIIQPGFNSNEFIHTWDTAKAYILEVQEYSREGCPGPRLSGEIMVNKAPILLVNATDTLVCNSGSVDLSVRNIIDPLWGQWAIELHVEAEKEISGYSRGSVYTGPFDLTQTLFNHGTTKHKVVYRFTPRIIFNDMNLIYEEGQQSITIWVNPGLKFSKELSDYNGYNVSCFGESDGFIRIIPGEGSKPCSYDWTGPGGFHSENEKITNLTAGKYTITLKDRLGCSVAEEIILTEPGKLGMAISVSVSHVGNYNINCHGSHEGSLTILPVNNTGPVRYLWKDGYTKNTRNNMPAGIYRVIITDTNNCTNDTTVTLTEPERIKIEYDLSPALCPGKSDGKISLHVTGGIPGEAYNYLWSDNSTEKDRNHVPEGTYKVTVTDQAGCSVSREVFVNSQKPNCLIIPEAFTPNDDLINDTWLIDNKEMYPLIEITIYNRWGQVLWKSEKGYPIPWDGKSRGENLPVDSYHYLIDLHDGTRNIVGSVTIMR